MNKQRRNISIAGEKLSYTLTRKNVKNINLRIVKGGEICISAAPSVPVRVIEDFLIRKESWIREAVQKMQTAAPAQTEERKIYLLGEAVELPEGTDPLLWQKKKAAELLPKAYEEAFLLFEKDGFTKPVLKLRQMKSRWGSCMPSKGIITLNTALVGATYDCQLAVAAHELCHMLYPDHSKAFYDCLLKHFPKYMTCMEELKRTQSFLIYS